MYIKLRGEKMSFDINDYKLKHIVSLKDGLIENTRIEMRIEGSKYTFKIDNVKSEVIELVDYFKYGEVKLAIGSMEKKLKNFTYGKSYNDLNDHELYEIRYSKFKAEIESKEYDFEITGAGPTALRVSLYLKYNEIEKEETSLEKQLKNLILNEYGDIINDNVSYHEKLKELKEEYEEKQAEQEKIREEVEREKAEKERKWRELEERLNSNKPKNDKPFKMY